MNDDTRIIVERIDTLIRLVAVALVDGKKQKDQIRLLSVAGIKPSQIATILGTTGNTVNVALSSLRRDGLLPKGGKT